MENRLHLDNLRDIYIYMYMCVFTANPGLKETIQSNKTAVILKLQKKLS